MVHAIADFSVPTTLAAPDLSGGPYRLRVRFQSLWRGWSEIDFWACRTACAGRNARALGGSDMDPSRYLVDGADMARDFDEGFDQHWGGVVSATGYPENWR